MDYGEPKEEYHRGYAHYIKKYITQLIFRLKIDWYKEEIRIIKEASTEKIADLKEWTDFQVDCIEAAKEKDFERIIKMAQREVELSK
jgi:hypothetical protein